MSDEKIIGQADEVLRRKPPSAQQDLDAAYERLQAVKQGIVPAKHSDYVEDAEPRERRSFKNEMEMADHLEAEMVENDEYEAGQQRKKVEQRRQKLTAQLREGDTWSPQHQQEIAVATQRAQRYQFGMSELASAVRTVLANPQLRTPQIEQQIVAAATALGQEKLFLEGVQANVGRVMKAKQITAAQARLFDTVPELESPQNRAALLAYAVRELGVDAVTARSVSDPVMIAGWWKRMQAQKKAEKREYVDRPRKPTYQRGAGPFGEPMPDRMTTVEARERLRKTGSFDDALNLLTLRKEKRRDAR